MSNAERIIITAKYFYSNYKMARYLCKKLKLFPTILSNRHLNQPIHQIPWSCWNAIFRFLALLFKHASDSKELIVDSFPVANCQKNRIDKRKIFSENRYLG